MQRPSHRIYVYLAAGGSDAIVHSTTILVRLRALGESRQRARSCHPETRMIRRHVLFLRATQQGYWPNLAALQAPELTSLPILVGE